MKDNCLSKLVKAFESALVYQTNQRYHDLFSQTFMLKEAATLSGTVIASF